MTSLQQDILFVFLKSQYEIENARLVAIRRAYGNGIGSQNANICESVIEEIKRQIKILELETE